MAEVERGLLGWIQANDEARHILAVEKGQRVEAIAAETTARFRCRAESNVVNAFCLTTNSPPSARSLLAGRTRIRYEGAVVREPAIDTYGRRTVEP